MKKDKANKATTSWDDESASDSDSSDDDESAKSGVANCVAFAASLSDETDSSSSSDEEGVETANDEDMNDVCEKLMRKCLNKKLKQKEKENECPIYENSLKSENSSGFLNDKVGLPA